MIQRLILESFDCITDWMARYLVQVLGYCALACEAAVVALILSAILLAPVLLIFALFTY